MTGPVEEIRVRCPECSTVYDDWFRASINRALDPGMDDEYVEAASTATCPECGHKVNLGTLVVEDNVWTWRGDLPPENE